MMKAFLLFFVMAAASKGCCCWAFRQALPRPVQTRRRPQPFVVPPKPPKTALSAAKLLQYAPAAASLFNNMRTPASIIAGAIVPIGILAPPDLEGPKDEGKFRKALRLSYSVIAVATLMSELVSVMWATVAVNQLTERAIAPAESVWDLLRRDFDIPWLGCNSHFVAGMLGFSYLIGSRTFLRFPVAKSGLAGGVAALASSSLLLMMAIVNRGIQAGGGHCDATGGVQRYGSDVRSLVWGYLAKLVARASSWRSLGVLELTSVALFFGSMFVAAKAIWSEVCGSDSASETAAVEE